MKTILPKHAVRELEREINKASDALSRVVMLTEDHIEHLDIDTATAKELSALDLLDSLHDDAEDADVVLMRLFDLTEKLRRFTRIAKKGGRR